MAKLVALLELPTFPVAVWNLLRAISDKNATLASVAATLQDDPALSAKMLSVANSPQYKSSRAIETIGHAVAWLGKEATASIALSVSLSSLKDERKDFRAGYKRFWIRSFMCGIAMEELAYRLKLCNTNKAYLLGLLMGIGQVAQLMHDPAAFTDLESSTGLSWEERRQRERKLFTADYAELGASILSTMSMPLDFVEFISDHVKTPQEIAALSSSAAKQMASAGRIASGIAQFLCDGVRIKSLLATRQFGREFLSLDDGTLNEVIDSVERRANEKAKAFNVDLSNMPSTSELYGEATERLAQLLLDGSATKTETDQEAAKLRKECEELRQMLARAERRACLDSLTGTFNREYFDGRIRERVQGCQANGSRLGLLLIDLDRFKDINDEHGHLAGDAALQATAAAIGAVCGEAAVLCRYGGDEFMVLLDIDHQRALNDAGEDVLRKVSRLKIQVDNKTELSVALSIGGVVAQPLAGESDPVQQIIRNADAAMYKAKRGGGNRVEIVVWPQPSLAPLLMHANPVPKVCQK